MFCPNCGNELSNEARFCGNCGTSLVIDESDVSTASADLNQEQMPGANNQDLSSPVESLAAPTAFASAETAPPDEAAPSVASSPAPAPSAPEVSSARSGVNPMFTNSLKILRGFFSRYTFRIVSAATKSKTLEGTLFAAACVLFFSLALPINLLQFDLLSDKAVLSLNFFAVFGMSLLTGIVTYGALVGVVYALLNFVLKKKTDIFPTINMIGVAAIPMTIAFLLNMLLGFWTPLAIISVAVAAMISFVLLYHGVKTLAGVADDSIFFHFVASMAVVFIVALLFLYINYLVAVDAVIITNINAFM